MFGKPSIRSKLSLALALPVAAALLLGVAGAAGAWSDRAGAREEGRTARVPGLARRAQALADRQLRLLEEPTLDEPDPRRRQGLAGVGHLATRLRRAAETLLVMAGPGPGRAPGRTWCTWWPSWSTTPPPSRPRRRPSWSPARSTATATGSRSPTAGSA